MGRYRVIYTKQAKKDAIKIKHSNMQKKTFELIELIGVDPYKTPPSYEKLIGELNGAYSRRINIHHRLVYQVLEDEMIIKVLRMWTHYEK